MVKLQNVLPPPASFAGNSTNLSSSTTLQTHLAPSKRAPSGLSIMDCMLPTKKRIELHKAQVKVGLVYAFAFLNNPVFHPFNSMSSQDYENLQQAVFDHAFTGLSQKDCAIKYEIPEWKIQRAHARWKKSPPDREPQTFRDISIPQRNNGHPTTLTPTEEKLVKEVVTYYSSKNNPLTRNDLRQVTSHICKMLPPARRFMNPFSVRLPSNKWVGGFLKRHPELAIRSVKVIESKRVEAVTRQNVCEHISRLQETMNRYGITEARRVFNLDESGVSFRKMGHCSCRKVVGLENNNFVCSLVRTKGNLDRLTVMCVVNAAGEQYKPVVVYPGKKAHFRRIHGSVETILDYLPPCYFYQREVAGVDSAIFLDWAKGFISETQNLRAGGKKLLLLLDGYASHVQYSVLYLLHQNNVVVIGLPAHTSHVLQPLDVSVFSSFKSYI